jgi:hypothetical protein
MSEPGGSSESECDDRGFVEKSNEIIIANDARNRPELRENCDFFIIIMSYYLFVIKLKLLLIHLHIHHLGLISS